MKELQLRKICSYCKDWDEIIDLALLSAVFEAKVRDIEVLGSTIAHFDIQEEKGM